MVVLMRKQNDFKRYEYKYLLTVEQKEELLDLMQKYMIEDEYGQSLICNLYFDTEKNILIRRSIENKTYKEKIRLRTYGRAKENSEAFIEIKKKYEKIVYKRRIHSNYIQAIDYLCKNIDTFENNQIHSELNYLLSFYIRLRPKMYLSYERKAYYGKEDPNLRITFDQNILWRIEDLDLRSEVYGNSLLESNQVLTEIKVTKSIPLWLSHFLATNKIYRTSFSKYGRAYCTLCKEGVIHYD